MDQRLETDFKLFHNTITHTQCLMMVAPLLKERKETVLRWLTDVEKELVSEAKGNLVCLESQNQSSTENIKIDDVREILDKLSLGRWSQEHQRYVLVPYAENLTTEASNALLKILEEPPERTTFILIVTSRNALLNTVQSRSHIISLSATEQQENSLDELEQNAFYSFYFKKGDIESLKRLKKEDFLTQWQDFYKNFPSLYKKYQPEKREVWYEMIVQWEDVKRKIDRHIDPKWILSELERKKTYV